MSPRATSPRTESALKKRLRSELVLADELKPFVAESARQGWEKNDTKPILVRGGAGRYTVVSGLNQFLRDPTSLFVEVLVAEDASVADYGPDELAALVAARPVVHLSGQVSSWLSDVIAHAPGCREIWLFGSRAGGTARPDSDWDSFMKGPRGLASRMRTGTRFERDDVDFFVWEDGAETAVNPWHADKAFNVNMAWHQLSEDYAEYDGVKGTSESFDVRRCRAVRVWPIEPAG
jgi:hypothetical protein